MTDATRETVERDMRRLSGALQRLGEALSEPEASSKSCLDTAQAFEYAMDLFWKVAKEMLAARGIEARMPRQAVQAAHERGWIADPSAWVEMLKDEYELSGGDYDQAAGRRLYPRIRTYYPEMCRVHGLMAARLEEM